MSAAPTSMLYLAEIQKNINTSDAVQREREWQIQKQSLNVYQTIIGTDANFFRRRNYRRGNDSHCYHWDINVCYVSDGIVD